ncbi:MAG: formate--tetrahydrofolate ligase [Candidatus Thermoplasmatota archaeon]|nr:formate--tetrahydrofolate ligase [Candidatus Thermoplasmatota archaeon]
MSGLLPIEDIAIGVEKDELEPYGKHKAKIDLKILKRIEGNRNGKLICVTAITPTPYGEGKTTTAIGLSMALNREHRSIVTLRQPSMGPTFGIKGGATGGGASTVEPSDEINMHFTGDIHACSIAQNLLVAMLDNHIKRGNELHIDPFSIMANRVVDIEDRGLRHIVTGLGGKGNGGPREARYDIAVASETMAILALAKDLRDLRARLGRMVVAFNEEKKPVTAEDIKAAGAMAAILKDAAKPNLVQTSENTPALIHAGPFANVAHGNSSIIADRIALKLADYVVTESGFGSDNGFVKFCDIKCRNAGFKPDVAVIVATVRALKHHGHGDIEKGIENLEKHIENVHIYGVPAIVAVNRFKDDSERDLEYVKERAKSADAVVIIDPYAKGSEGCMELAKAVENKSSDFRFLYPLEERIDKKIEIIAKKIYGADSVEYTSQAMKKIEQFEELGWGNLPINVAKTHLSLSDNPSKLGRPKGFIVTVKDIRASVGAGFLYPLMGNIETMPGLPKHPNAESIDIDEEGNIKGLF